MEPIIKVKCLKHVYPDRTEVNICGLDFVVNPGEKIVILGPNGAGKTTLLSHILGLLSPVDGTVEVMGLRPDKNFNTIRKNIGVVFQNVDEQIIGPRVYDDIAFTLRNERVDKKEIDERVKNVAGSLEIEHLLEKIPHYLSGGQKKKVALAGAMIMMPKILIMDEPFDALDPKSKTEMVNLLNHLSLRILYIFQCFTTGYKYIVYVYRGNSCRIQDLHWDSRCKTDLLHKSSPLYRK